MSKAISKGVAIGSRKLACGSIMNLENRIKLELSKESSTRLMNDIINLSTYKKLDLMGLNKLLMKPMDHMKQINELQAVSKEILMKNLDENILNQLESIANYPNRSDIDVLLIKNLPFKGSSQVHFGELIQLGLSKLLNMNPFTYVNEHGGRLLHHIRPKLEEAQKQTGLSSQVDLTLHIENAFDPIRPDYLALYCHIPNKNAVTSFLSMMNILKTSDEHLRQRILSIGTRNEFVFLLHHSFKDGKSDRGPLVYLIDSGKIGTRYCYSNHFVQGTSEEAKQLLKDINDHVDMNREAIDNPICLDSGDLVIWNNHTTSHGRSAYPTKYNDKCIRHLTRMYLTKNLDLPQLRK